MLVLVLGKQLEEEVEGMRKFKGGWLGEFSEPWSEVFPCQSQGSLGDEFFEVHSTMHLLILNFHNWPW